MIHDLRERINSHRVTPPLQDAAFLYGFNTDILADWMDYWANDYDFKEREDYLNQYHQYMMCTQGLNIYFIWEKPKVSPGVEVVPLLLLHGWPGSVREFYEAIPLITAACEGRDFAVEVIAPSLPGFGFSDGATRPGFGTAEIAVVLRNFMHRLGFKKFYLQGGNFGALISNDLVTMFPEEVLGYHTNFALTFSPASMAMWTFGSISESLQSLVVSSSVADRMYPIFDILKFIVYNSGYLHLQATKPDTIGAVLSQSPAGLFAYTAEHFAMGSGSTTNIYRKDGGLYIFSKEELIDNAMFYWASGAITTAFRIYSEYFNTKTIKMGIVAIPSETLTWTMHAKGELVYQSQALLQFKFPNLVNSTILNTGGHFLALQLPEIFSADLLTAIGAFRRCHARGVKDEL